MVLSGDWCGGHKVGGVLQLLGVEYDSGVRLENRDGPRMKLYSCLASEEV